jgi:hypothetical protein
LLARMVAEIQHGVFDAGRHGEDRVFSLVELCFTLDCMRDRALFEFTRPFMAGVLKPERREGDRRLGPDFMLVDVGGGRTGYRTVAACPPVAGDCWKLLLPLRRGRYQLIVSGWRNPHHGILDMTLDNEAISPSDGLDWYSDTSTTLHTFPPIPLEVTSTGTHILRGETSRCNSNALGARYWMCLESLRILPAGEVVEVEPDTPTDARPADRLPSHRETALQTARDAAFLLATAVAAVTALSACGASWIGRQLHGLLGILACRRRWPFPR